jgi:hypothetical protein
MEYDRSLEADNRLAGQILWNPNIYYRFLTNPPVVPMLSHVSQVHTLITKFFKVSFNIILTSMLRSPR